VVAEVVAPHQQKSRCSVIHLRIAAQVAVQDNGMRAAAELVDERAQDLSGRGIFQRNWHAFHSAIGMNDHVQVDGSVVVGRKLLRQRIVRGLWF
jgi:hypothetical protein